MEYLIASGFIAIVAGLWRIIKELTQIRSVLMELYYIATKDLR